MQKNKKLTFSNLLKIAAITTFSTVNIANSDTNNTNTMFSGLCYSPFRSGQNPIYQIFPSDIQIQEDMGKINNLTTTIRTYGVDSGTVMERIPLHAQEAGIEIYPGCWIDNKTWDQEQIDALIAVGNSSLTNIQGLIVGNEYLYRHPSNSANLISKINEVKAATGKKVAASEQWHIWRDNPSLASTSDFLFVHIHPYWEEQHIDNAVNHVIEKYELIQNLYPSKRIVISETGWPTAGSNFGLAHPSQENHDRFVKEFSNWARSNSVEYLFFEAFDELWKSEGSTGVGPHWGILGENRHDKGGIQSMLENRMDISIKKKNTGIKLICDTFENFPFELNTTGNLVSWVEIPFIAKGYQHEINLNNLTSNEFYKLTAETP